MSLTKVSGAILKDPLNLGEVSIGGTLTYQDVTNVDSVGIITARSGINVSGGEIVVGSNIKIGNAGIITASSLDISGDLDVDGHTNLDNVSVSGVSTFNNNVHLLDNDYIRFGSSQDLSIFHDGTHNWFWSGGGHPTIHESSGSWTLRSVANQNYIIATENNSVDLYYSGTKRFETTSTGANVTGNFGASGNISLSGSFIMPDSLLHANDTTTRIRFPAPYTITAETNGVERIRIDSSGRVMIGGGSSPSQVGDGQLIVYSSDRLHPAIKVAGTSSNHANGYSMISDNYTSTESQINLGVSYSSSGLVLSRSVKVSGSQDDVYLSSQGQYATRPCAIKLDELGAFNFLTTETNATVATDSAVSLTEVFKIDRVGNVYQRITNRFMYFGASNVLRIGTNGADPMIDAVSGDLQIKDAGSSVCVVRSDGFQMYQGVYPASNNSKDLGKSGSIWSGVFANYARLHTNLAVGSGNSLQNANVASFKGNDYNQINIAHSANSSWGMLLTNSNSNSYNGGYHATTNSSVSSPIAMINVNNDCLYLGTNNSARWRVEHNGHFIPLSTFNIGSSTYRAGTVYATNSYNTSDRNEKNTITESDLGLDFICKLKPVSYKWNQKEGEGLDTKTHYGLISQDVEDVIIETGKTLDDFGAIDKSDGDPMGLSYTEFISPLIKSIQEQQEQIKTLKAEVSALKSQINN